MPNRREAVLHVLVRILADAEADTRVLVAHVVDTDVDALGPFRTVGMNLVHRRRHLMAHHFVKSAQHRTISSRSSAWSFRKYYHSEPQHLRRHIEHHRN